MEEGDNFQDTVATFAVNIPRYRHGVQRCKDAKMDELNKFEVFYAYEQVSDQGQQRLGTNWVLVEKIKDGKPIVKARLTIRGDLEDTKDVKTDASSVKKSECKNSPYDCGY